VGDNDGVLEAPTVSPVGEALRHVRMSGVFYCPSELTEPWGLMLPPMENCLWFHMVTSGSCTVEVDGHEPLLARSGDLVLMSQGLGHRAWGRERVSTPNVLDLPHEEVSERYARLRYGGGGDPTYLVCGGVRFDHPTARHLVASLPAIIHIESRNSLRGDWMRATLDLMADETRQVHPGSEAVVSRLCDIIVIQAIRTWIERDPAARTGWLGALHDPGLGAAIASIHAEPARRWTVGLLAERAAMSRSAFAARFTEIVGEPVMGYVTRWRMYHAVDLLESGGHTVAVVAAEVGYESEAAFSRAFKRIMGRPPATFRS